MLLTIGLELKLSRDPARRRLAWIGCAFLWLAWLELAFDWHRAAHVDHAIAPLDDRPVVCIGDSLTSYSPRGYPRDLAWRLSVGVVNLGAPGITSAEALKKAIEKRAE